MPETCRAKLLSDVGEKTLRREYEGLRRQLPGAPESCFQHNDYLDLRRHPTLRAKLVAALESGEVCTTSTGSRLLSGDHGLLRELEEDLAFSTGAGAALIFGSASEANHAALATLAGRRDAVILDALAHASLHDGALRSGAARRRFRHDDPEDLRRVLRATAARRRVVAVESVYSMDGDLGSLPDLLTVCEDEDALLFVDETHATGLWGVRRTGLAENLPRDGALVATVHGFGKALASQGGVLCAPPQVVDAVIDRCRSFIYTTAPSPLQVLATRCTLELAREDLSRRQRLSDRIRQLREGLHGSGLLTEAERRHPTPIVPVKCGGIETAVRLAQAVSRVIGSPVRPIRAPTVPEGTERLRLTVSSDTSPRRIEDLICALNEAAAE